MKTIKNFTPHVINIVENVIFDASQRKFLTTNETKTVVSIAPCGELLSANQKNTEAESINGIPTKKMEFSGVSEAPKDCWCIVSAMYVAACKGLGINTDNLLTIGDAVYDSETIKPIGTLNLIRN